MSGYSYRFQDGVAHGHFRSQSFCDGSMQQHQNQGEILSHETGPQKLMSCFKISGFSEILVRMWIDFIASTDSYIKLEKFSQLVAAGCALFLCLVMALVYKNDIMVYF